MNIYLKKRKQSVFNSYKTVRASISLNHLHSQPTEYAWQEAMVIINWEAHWLEQVIEVKSEACPMNQTAMKQNKLITKWWENN